MVVRSSRAIILQGSDLPKKSFFIVTEGIDQSGKETQSELLRKRFRKEGYKSVMISFPNYKTGIGKLIKSFLNGKIQCTPKVRHMLLSANRWETKAEIEDYLRGKFTLICNRYHHSNIPYGMANGLKRSWLESLDRGLPEPDVVVLLDITPKISLARKPGGRDIHERDLSYLERVRKQYLELAREEDWIVINGEKSIEQVSRDIWRALSKKLGIRQT